METVLRRPAAVAPASSRVASGACVRLAPFPCTQWAETSGRVVFCGRRPYERRQQTTPLRASTLEPGPSKVVDQLEVAEPLTELQLQAQLRREQRMREQRTYQLSAIFASSGMAALAVTAVYYRFWWHLQADGQVPWLDVGATLLLVLGGVIGMEYWARWAHKALWHDFEPGWALHESHHRPRVGPFEANDVFAIINAVPAMGLCAYGFMRPDVYGGICFGAGLGITLFGILYMMVHDGLVHKRFPVGPVANVPYLKRVAVAHKLHHSEKYHGVPWGLFLGPAELEAVGAKEELDKMVADLEL